MPARRSKAGAAKKRPVRYGREAAPASPALVAALRAHRKGDLVEAIGVYQRALEAGESVDAWMNLGSALAALGRAREARRALSRAALLAPDHARLQRDVGIGFAAIGHAAEARTALERAVALDASLSGASLFLVRLLLEVGDRAGAVQCGQRALERRPAEAALHLELHRALFDDRAPGDAIAAAERAVALDPRWELARLQLGAALALEGSHAQARAVHAALGPRAASPLDAIRYALDRRDDATRFFASSRETLVFALQAAAGTGPVLEFGVRHGTSTRVLAAHAARLHAFDSFQGLPEPWYGREPGAFTTAGEVPDLPAHVEVHVGLFSQTLPVYLAQRPAPPRLVHVDSDLYSSARDVLSALGSSIGPGCVIVFDEYIGNDRWREDEHRAFREAVASHRWRYRYLAFNWFTGQAVVRVE
jgi:tetratricopeptide (TPR) repeat protein